VLLDSTELGKFANSQLSTVQESPNTQSQLISTLSGYLSFFPSLVSSTHSSQVLRFNVAPDHRQRQIESTTHLDDRSALRRDLYLTTHTLTSNRQPCPRRDSNPQSHQATGRATTGSAKWLPNYNNFNTNYNGHTKRESASCNLLVPISPQKHVQPSERPFDWPVLLKHSLVLFKNSLTFTKHPMDTTLTKGKLSNKPPF